MKNVARFGVTLVTAFGALALVSCSSGDGEFPSESFELVIPYSAGGATDTAGRVLAAELEQISGESVMIVNRPGGGAAVGLTEAAQSDPSGYEMILAPGSAFATLPLTQQVSYGPEDFRSVGGLYDQPYVIVTAADSPIKSLDDLSKADGRITYTTFAIGHVAHLSLGNVLDKMGVQGEAVPYNSASESLQAVTSGQVDVGVIDMNIAAGQLDSGEVNALAINTDERLPDFPDIPAFGEAGYPDGAGYLSRIAIAVPKETPDAEAEKLQQMLDQAFNSDGYQKYLKDNYLLAPEYAGKEFFEEYVPAEKERAVDSFDKLGIDHVAE